MRNEGYLYLASRDIGKGLLNLGGVTVLARFVSGERLVGIGIVSSWGGISSRACNSGCGVDEYAFGLNEPVFESGGAGEGDRGGIAAGISDDLRLFYVVSVELGKTVFCVFVEFGVRIRTLVPRGISLFVVHTEVRAQVDEQLALCKALLCKRLGKTVRKRGEDDVAFFDYGVGVFKLVICDLFEIRIYLGELFALVRN